MNCFFGLFSIYIIFTVIITGSHGFFDKLFRTIQESIPVYREPPPEAFMTTPQLIQHYNYTVEEHYVITKDLYILSMFRIPPRKFNPQLRNEPVIIQHGLLCSSDDWFILPPADIFPFLLADQGFDVWLGNSRGNNYSQGHLRESIDSPKYWNFTFHEMGKYDIPAVINYVLKETGKSQLSFVGHSMGTTMFFIAMDQHPQLQSKIRKMVALAPVAYLTHVKTPLSILALAPSPAYTNQFMRSLVIQSLMEILNGGRIFSGTMNAFLKKFAPYICSGDIPSAMCENIFFLITGYNYLQVSEHTASMITGHTPSDASGKTLVHYLQWVRTAAFQQFDYGLAGNYEMYGRAMPPRYNLTAITVDTLAMYALNDWLVVPKDTIRAIDELGRAVYLEVADPNFNHLDFTYAGNAKSMVYDYCVDFLTRSEKK